MPAAKKPAAKKPAAKKAAPKTNILAAMREEIIQSQIAIAKKLGGPVTQKTPAIPKPKDPKTQKLVAFLLSKPFGCNTEKAIDFAEILHGDIRKYMPPVADKHDDDHTMVKYLISGTIYQKSGDTMIIIRRDTDGDVIDCTVSNTSTDEMLMEDTNHYSDIIDRDPVVLPMLTETLIRSTVAKFSDLMVTQTYTAMKTIKDK